MLLINIEVSLNHKNDFLNFLKTFYVNFIKQKYFLKREGSVRASILGPD